MNATYYTLVKIVLKKFITHDCLCSTENFSILKFSRFIHGIRKQKWFGKIIPIVYYLPLIFILMTNTQGQVCCGVSNSGIKIDFLEKNECTEKISCFWFSSETKNFLNSWVIHKNCTGTIIFQPTTPGLRIVRFLGLGKSCIKWISH